TTVLPQYADRRPEPPSRKIWCDNAIWKIDVGVSYGAAPAETDRIVSVSDLVLVGYWPLARPGPAWGPPASQSADASDCSGHYQSADQPRACGRDRHG